MKLPYGTRGVVSRKRAPALVASTIFVTRTKRLVGCAVRCRSTDQAFDADESRRVSEYVLFERAAKLRITPSLGGMRVLSMEAKRKASSSSRGSVTARNS